MEEERKSLQEPPKDKRGQGGRDRKRISREAAVHLSQHTEKQKRSILLEAPALCHEWRLAAAGT